MVRSYVALGDSFTAGNGIRTGHRWADLLAVGLAAGRDDFEYVNLARDGADSGAVMETIEPTVDLQPDLVTLICGANDVLLNTRPDIGGFGERFDLMLGRLRRGIPGVRLMVSTYPDDWRLPGLGARTRRRIDEGIRSVNRIIIETAADHSVLCLDVTRHPGIREPGNLDEDGLHPSALGHRRAAREYARALEDHFGLTQDRRSITT